MIQHACDPSQALSRHTALPKHSSFPLNFTHVAVLSQRPFPFSPKLPHYLLKFTLSRAFFRGRDRISGSNWRRIGRRENCWELVLGCNNKSWNWENVHLFQQLHLLRWLLRAGRYTANCMGKQGQENVGNRNSSDKRWRDRENSY